MEQLIINGVNATGTINALPGMGIELKKVQIDVPMDSSGVDPYVLISGSATGANTFHNDVTLDLEFQKGEDVNISGTNFAADHSAIISYVRFGDQRCYKAITSKHHNIPTPWRFR